MIGCDGGRIFDIGCWSSGVDGLDFGQASSIADGLERHCCVQAEVVLALVF